MINSVLCDNIKETEHMNAKALILDGQINAARTLLVDQVKKTPADIQARSLLFQVMLLCGEWDKAQRQLDIAASQLASPEMNVPVYQNLIQAEKERIAVSKRQQRPTFFPDIPEYSEDFFQALDLLEKGKIDDGANLLARIDAGLPDVRGTLNGQPFKGFKETDTTLTYFIEAIEYERYLWVPIANIREFAVSPPQTLIDLIWAKGRITTWEGLTMGCFLPVLYPIPLPVMTTASGLAGSLTGNRWEDPMPKPLDSTYTMSEVRTVPFLKLKRRFLHLLTQTRKGMSIDRS